MNENEFEYGSGAVFGSLAYDFSNPVLFPDLTREPGIERTAPPREEEQEQALPVARPRYAVAPTAVLGIALAAVVLVFSLFARAELVELSEAAAEQSMRLETLYESQTRLLIDYESTFNLHEIERIAINEFGMQKARGDQIFYVGSVSPDRAVVIAQDATSLKGRVGAILDTIGACFR